MKQKAQSIYPELDLEFRDEEVRIKGQWIMFRYETLNETDFFKVLDHLIEVKLGYAQTGFKTL